MNSDEGLPQMRQLLYTIGCSFIRAEYSALLFILKQIGVS